MSMGYDDIKMLLHVNKNCHSCVLNVWDNLDIRHTIGGLSQFSAPDACRPFFIKTLLKLQKAKINSSYTSVYCMISSSR